MHGWSVGRSVGRSVCAISGSFLSYSWRAYETFVELAKTKISYLRSLENIEYNNSEGDLHTMLSQPLLYFLFYSGSRLMEDGCMAGRSFCVVGRSVSWLVGRLVGRSVGAISGSFLTYSSCAHDWLSFGRSVGLCYFWLISFIFVEGL